MIESDRDPFAQANAPPLSPPSLPSPPSPPSLQECYLNDQTSQSITEHRFERQHQCLIHSESEVEQKNHQSPHYALQQSASADTDPGNLFCKFIGPTTSHEIADSMKTNMHISTISSQELGVGSGLKKIDEHKHFHHAERFRNPEITETLKGRTPQTPSQADLQYLFQEEEAGKQIDSPPEVYRPPCQVAGLPATGRNNCNDNAVGTLAPSPPAVFVSHLPSSPGTLQPESRLQKTLKPTVHFPSRQLDEHQAIQSPTYLYSQSTYSRWQPNVESTSSLSGNNSPSPDDIAQIHQPNYPKLQLPQHAVSSQSSALRIVQIPSMQLSTATTGNPAAPAESKGPKPATYIPHVNNYGPKMSGTGESSENELVGQRHFPTRGSGGYPWHF